MKFQKRERKKKGEMPTLKTAVKRGDVALFHSMLEPLGPAERLAAVNERRTGGATFLHQAVQRGHVEICKLLIAEGAMLDHQDNNGQSPVLAAICKYVNKPVHTECIEVLLAAGADVHTSTFRQQTALHMAARRGLLDVCQCLLKYGANLEQFDSWGLAPIHDAAAKGKTNVVESMIVEYGMSVDHLDSDNNTVRNSIANHPPTPVDVASCWSIFSVHVYSIIALHWSNLPLFSLLLFVPMSCI